jgi:hypothetical protein
LRNAIMVMYDYKKVKRVGEKVVHEDGSPVDPANYSKIYCEITHKLGTKTELVFEYSDLLFRDVLVRTEAVRRLPEYQCLSQQGLGIFMSLNLPQFQLAQKISTRFVNNFEQITEYQQPTFLKKSSISSSVLKKCGETLM